MTRVSDPPVLSCTPCVRLVVFLAACLLLFADAGARDALLPLPADPAIRSAQLFARDGQWESATRRSVEGERSEIRAHFTAVGEILRNDTFVNLGVAVARFEMAFRLRLTPARRAELRSWLAARRQIQIDRLGRYARAGSFPLNRHYAGEARPIFVDAEGTHCAVGHLMALDGWEAEVMAIARATPNVLVGDVDRGPLVIWLLTSGLIQEEAALIQPGYYPPTNTDTTPLTALIVPGASLDRDGFRYENFAFSASSTGGAATLTAAQMGIAPGWPPVSSNPNAFCFGLSPGCVLRADTLWFGFYGFGSPTSLGSDLVAGANQSISFIIDYDVVALAAGLAVGGTRTFTNSYYGGFQSFVPGTGSISTTLDNGVLGALVLDYPAFTYTIGERSESILLSAPVDRVHVRHSVQIANGQSLTGFDSVVLRAAAVPLPGSVGLLAMSLALLFRFVR